MRADRDRPYRGPGQAFEDGPQPLHLFAQFPAPGFASGVSGSPLTSRRRPERRIAKPVPVGGRVVPRDLPAAAFVRERFHRLAPSCRTVAVPRAPAADVAPRLAHPGGVVDPIDERTCRLRTGSDTLEWLALRPLTLGVGFAVEDHRELVVCLRGMGERATRAAEGGDRG